MKLGFSPAYEIERNYSDTFKSSIFIICLTPIFFCSDCRTPPPILTPNALQPTSGGSPTLRSPKMGRRALQPRSPKPSRGGSSPTPLRGGNSPKPPSSRSGGSPAPSCSPPPPPTDESTLRTDDPPYKVMYLPILGISHVETKYLETQRDIEKPLLYLKLSLLYIFSILLT